ncbi:protein ALTERED XYLOGLUCAN 4-like [Asparagus officinalis]|uniref:protein ALTERED XYLOGLUCAN 4-like n=1 Tax=Asparagus officinalis TaxID=4686 RepID=UPI00098DEAAE|nr:protein ALTERED XYLOGLUCAN 4-like [Asparagus officinalis]
MFKSKISFFSCLLALSTLSLIIILGPSNPFTVIKPTQENSANEKYYCDLSEGKWVGEPKGSLYTNSTCRMLPEMKNCVKYGKDKGYLYWKWKPERCELPRFDAMEFLRVVRGKKMAFVGDSLARNQMESLLCLLSQAESPTDTYKDPTDKSQTWHFPSHNFTLMAIWSQFLVHATETTTTININATLSNTFNLHLDKVNPKWSTDLLPHLHFILISAGNWFFRQNYLYLNETLIGCIWCNDKNLTGFDAQFAIRKVFRTTLQFIASCEECDDGLVTLLRTFSPSHFEHGSWFTGGYCNRTQPLDEGELRFERSKEMEIRGIQLEELERVRGKKRRFEVLDVTKAVMLRADGHPGEHVNRKWTNSSIKDCLHWCLPGPVDMWNDVLLQTIKT